MVNTLSQHKNEPANDQKYKDRIYENVTPQLGRKLALDDSVVKKFKAGVKRQINNVPNNDYKRCARYANYQSF